MNEAHSTEQQPESTVPKRFSRITLDDNGRPRMFCSYPELDGIRISIGSCALTITPDQAVEWALSLVAAAGKL